METILRRLMTCLALFVYTTSLATENELRAMDNPGPGIRSRFVENHNGLRMHVLEAGEDIAGRPCVILLHGFPELAYSWRRILPALADAGYYVVAPDQRGFGRTTGADTSYDGDLSQYRPLNLVRDVIGLVAALGRRDVHVVGRDAGSAIAAWCALIRPDTFRSVTIMTSPFAGPPLAPFNTARTNAGRLPAPNSIPKIDADLRQLAKPRKHYQFYYTTREANSDMINAPQGLHAFLRGYFHQKSGDWPGNSPFRLSSWAADEFAKMPPYYVMNAAETMAATVVTAMPSPEAVAANTWLSESELAIYTEEYRRTGFQGGLNWYRARISGKWNAELELFSGRTIDVPACYVAGDKDWGTYQIPGAFEQMQRSACSRLLGVHFVKGAGHWVEQEGSTDVARLLVEFLHDVQGQK